MHDQNKADQMRALILRLRDRLAGHEIDDVWQMSDDDGTFDDMAGILIDVSPLAVRLLDRDGLNPGDWEPSGSADANDGDVVHWLHFEWDHYGSDTHWAMFCSMDLESMRCEWSAHAIGSKAIESKAIEGVVHIIGAND